MYLKLFQLYVPQFTCNCNEGDLPIIRISDKKLCDTFFKLKTELCQCKEFQERRLSIRPFQILVQYYKQRETLKHSFLPHVSGVHIRLGALMQVDS